MSVVRLKEAMRRVNGAKAARSDVEDAGELAVASELDEDALAEREPYEVEGLLDR